MHTIRIMKEFVRSGNCNFNEAVTKNVPVSSPGVRRMTLTYPIEVFKAFTFLVFLKLCSTLQLPFSSTHFQGYDFIRKVRVMK